MSFRLKTILGIGAIEALLLAILIGSVLNFLHSSNERQFLERASTTAELFASTTQDAVISNDLASLESYAEELMSNPGLAYVRITNSEGTVLTEKGVDDALKRNLSPDESVEAVSDGIFDSSASINIAGIPYGRVQIGHDIREMQRLQADARDYSLLLAGIEMGLVAEGSPRISPPFSMTCHRFV